MFNRYLRQISIATLFGAVSLSWQVMGSHAAGGELLLDLDTTLSPQQLTESLQKGIDAAAAAGKSLRIANRGAVIRIARTIYLPSGSDLDFNHCTIKRDVGHGVFDMMLNKNRAQGDRNISVQNLKIDGNKDADRRNAMRREDRFTGLGMFRVSQGKLRNIEVSNTVNGEIQSEGARAGIYFEGCQEITAEGIKGHHNDRTAVLIHNSSVSISDSVTNHNSGSGISSSNADNSEYRDIVSHDNGYSQISVNGQNSKIFNVQAYNCSSGYACLNIGHNSEVNDSSNSVANGVKITGGRGWGITVNGSSGVFLSDVSVSGSSGFNIYLMENSSGLKLENVKSFGSQATGIYYKSGTGHSIDRAEVYDNRIYGVEIARGAEVTIGPEVRIYGSKKNYDGMPADLVVSGTARLQNSGSGQRRMGGEIPNLWVAGGTVYLPRGQAGSFNVRKTSGGTLAETR
jgi:hypothetical protein